MSERSAQALAYIQKFSLEVSGPNGQQFAQFNQAVQVINEELSVNEKTVQELTTKVAELNVSVETVKKESYEAGRIDGELEANNEAAKQVG